MLILIFVPFHSVNTKQISNVKVSIQVVDVNEYAPELSKYYEIYVCENAIFGQVRIVCLTVFRLFSDDI